MSQSTSRSELGSKPSRKRPVWEKVLVWGGIVTLLLIVLMEWKSRDGYSATLADFEESLGRDKSIPSSDIDRHIHGWVTRSEAKKANLHVITLRWPSLFKKYSLGLPLTAAGQINLVDADFESDSNSDFSKPIASKAGIYEKPHTVDPPEPTKSELVKFSGRLPPGYDHVMALRFEEKFSDGNLAGVLPREIVRQAVLIAAEEELQLATLDPSLGEGIPEGTGPAGPVTILFSAPMRPKPKDKIGTSGGPMQYRLAVVMHRETPDGHLNWQAPGFDMPTMEGMETLIERAEACSREEFVEGLKHLGFEKATTTTTTTEEVLLPDSEMDFVSQFTRIRQLHQQLRNRGESPEILGELVRAYANLGNMTDYLWAPSSKALKARSLIYAQRLVAKHGASPFTLAHQAYAQAMAGRHAPAMKSVRDAKAATGTAAPEWLDLVSAYCEYKPQLMTQEADGRDHLANYLKMRMADLKNDEEEALKAIQQVLSDDPTCCRAVECLSSITSLGPKRIGSEVSIGPVWRGIYERLAQVTGVPDKAKSIATNAAMKSRRPGNDVQQRVELIKELEQATDIKSEAGPSWSALAGLMRDTSMVQIWRLADLEFRMLGVSTANTLRLYGPLIEGHPHEHFVLSFTEDRAQRSRMLSSYLDPKKKIAFNVNMLPVYGTWSANPDSPAAGRFLQSYKASTDPLAEDVLCQSGYYDIQSHPVYKTSPRWPMVVAIAISDDIGITFAECEEEYADSPTVLMALYQRYLFTKSYEDAERCARKIVERKPSHASYRALAFVLKERGEIEEWREAAAKSLEFPTFGLESAWIHRELAEEAANREDWQAAKPHALEAADSYSNWGLTEAAYIHERLEEWDEAEKYIRASSERYDDSVARWYFWCVRTGHGDTAKAKQLATRFWASKPQAKDDRSLQWDLSNAKVLDGDLAGAIVHLQLMQAQGDTNSATRAAVLADELGQTQLRDKIFKELEPKWHANTGFVELTHLFRGVLSGKPNCRWNRNTFEQLLLNADPEVAPDMYFDAGKFLQNHGEPELGDEYLKRTAASGRAMNASCLAIDALRKRNIEIPKRETTVLPKELHAIQRRLDKINKARRNRMFEECDVLVDEIVASRPDFAPAYIIRGAYRESRKQFSQAATDYEQATQLDPNYACAQLKLSWLLSTCPEDSVRDGKRALKLAEAALALRQFDTALNESTLAAAYAECGDFTKAIESETKAASLPKFDPSDQFRVELYRQKKPLRQFSMAGEDVNFAK
jgi:tetratricopeptide (TPR) repeat protein